MAHNQKQEGILRYLKDIVSASHLPL
jgi:hypothetical protein